MHIEELLDEEVTALAGERYARKAPRRHWQHLKDVSGWRRPARAAIARLPRGFFVSRSTRPLRVVTTLALPIAVNGLWG